jgi:predicted alpha-1,2-mannosidase
MASLLSLAAACGEHGPAGFEQTPPYPSSFARLVDPFIGTGGEGNTFPGPVAPWGMVSVSPHSTYSTPVDYLKGAPLAPAGYVRSVDSHLGFGLTHLSGVGCPDLGAPVVAATSGPVLTRAEDYGSTRTGDVAWPGYYAVELGSHGVWAEATAGDRVGLIRYRFSPDRGPVQVLVDAARSLSWFWGSGAVRLVSNSEVEGHAETGFFCARGNRQRIYFVARLSRPAHSAGTWKDDRLSRAREQQGTVGAYFRFDPPPEAPLEVRVGISYVSVDGARRNLQAAPEGGAFEALRRQTFQRWEQALSRIRVSGGTADQQKIFYTALYHTLIHPGLISDVDGRHPLMGKAGSGTAAGAPRYSVFSLWDTYRTVHPLLTLVYPERQLELLKSMAAMAAESGRPPIWELAGAEVNMMVGDPAAIVVADSYLKGLTAFDARKLYEAMRKAALDTASATLHRPGNDDYRALGYIPMERSDEVWGPVSTTLEYAYADWALAALADRLGQAADAQTFRAQAAAYNKLFDARSGLLRPKNRDGSWYSPFSPDALEGSGPYKRSGGPGYVEGTAHNYAFFVPHDVAGLLALHGRDAFVKRLQAQFDGGKFAIWNEPDIAFPYLFTHVPGEAWRTRREVRRLMARHFTTGADGIPGNDDAGALSAWYVLSAIGLYPDDPVSDRYRLGSPLFPRVEIRLSPGHHGGQRFIIDAAGASAEKLHVKGASLGGRALGLPYLTHAQIAAGGTLELVMSGSR